MKHRHNFRALLLILAIALTSVVYAVTGPAGAGAKPATNAKPAATHAEKPAPSAKKKRTKDCFTSLAACGYPSRAAHDVGVSYCSKLPAFKRSHPPKGTAFDGRGLLEVTRANTTIKNLDFPASITILVKANNSTINHVCLLTNGAGASGSTALKVAPGTTGTKIEDSTFGGANRTTMASDQAITNDENSARTTATDDLLINCGECVHGTWTLDKSYVDATARIPGEHYEDWYFSDGTISANDDVFINPHEQTAEIFGNTNGGNGGAADNHLTVTNSLLAGGGFMIYTNSSSSSVGSSSMDISGNRFARCDGRAVFNSVTGGESCSGGVDAFGIWPRGGYFGVVYPNGAYCKAAKHTWTKNTWDNNRSRVGC